MGQGENRKDLRGHHRRERAQGQAILRNLTALVFAGLTLACDPQPVAAGRALLPKPATEPSRPAEVTVRFDQAKAWAHLLKQCAFGPRAPGSEGHLKTRDYLLAEFKKHTDNARLQEFRHVWSVTDKPVTMWNVIGEQNWEKAKVRVALFAHWDTRPTADMEWDRAQAAKPILGANDGASGVAVLLELMRVMRGQLPPDVGVLYVLTDGEDLGPELSEMFLGAKAFAQTLSGMKPRPDYGILLDMIGDRDLQVPMEPNSLRYAEKVTRAIYRHASTVGLATTFPSFQGPVIEDDHIPLNQAGLPTVDLIDFSYRPWHTLADTPDKCSAASLGKVGKLMETWLKKRPAFAP